LITEKMTRIVEAISEGQMIGIRVTLIADPDQSHTRLERTDIFLTREGATDLAQDLMRRIAQVEP
jgi:hypothetical protein